MNKEYKELNKLVAKHIGFNRNADEALFNFGVEFGRLLEKNGIEQHRLPLFVEQENNNNQYSERKLRIDSVANIIQNIIKLAHKKQVENYGNIYYESGYGSINHPLNADIENEYNITYRGIKQTVVGGDFYITFNVSGKLKAIFIKHQVHNEVEITLRNGIGGEYEYISTEHDAENCFRNTLIKQLSPGVRLLVA